MITVQFNSAAFLNLPTYAKSVVRAVKTSSLRLVGAGSWQPNRSRATAFFPLAGVFFQIFTATYIFHKLTHILAKSVLKTLNFERIGQIQNLAQNALLPTVGVARSCANLK